MAINDSPAWLKSLLSNHENDGKDKLCQLRSEFLFYPKILQYSKCCGIVKSYVKALDLYNFIRRFGWAYKQGHLYPQGIETE